MQNVTISQDRSPHWIKLNHQERIPKRWVAFDTEARSVRNGGTEIQTWAMGAAIRWRTDLKTVDHAEAATFDTPLGLWQWVSDHCRPDTRTVAVAHNLGYDIRISDALNCLPRLGFRLEWCNLDSNISSMTWRSDHGSLVFMDTWTWLPMDLRTVAPSVGLRKLTMPPDKASHYKWERYCLRDAEIVYRCTNELLDYIRMEGLGNWQPTGAGMAYATWRHKFMTQKILVHDNVNALTAERAAMHTGRAEAWKHGELPHKTWTELDMRNAYVTIASECELPVKLKMHTGAISNVQYHKLCDTYRVLAKCDIDSDLPVVPFTNSTRTLWPVGTFTTWLWDTEINTALREGTRVNIRETYVYTRGYILRDWATWVLRSLRLDTVVESPIVKTWLKHCSRALIGRLSLRCPQWEEYGTNPDSHAGITHATDFATGKVRRFLHVGNVTFMETGRQEGRDSLPQVTGWIMAECRSRLWRAMRDAGLSEIAHVDTDSLIVSRTGYEALRAAQEAIWRSHWQAKGSFRRMIVYAPRNYRVDGKRKAAGVPRKAAELLPNVFEGDRWSGLARDLSVGRSDAVTITHDKWTVKVKDPRRDDSARVPGETVPYQVTAGSTSAASSSGKLGDGA